MEQLIENVDQIVLGFVEGSFGNLSEVTLTLWRLMFVVFISIYGYKIIISGNFSAPDLLAHCFKIILLLVVATQWSVFYAFVYRMATDLPSDVTGELLSSASAAIGAGAQSELSANSALSDFFDRGMATTGKILDGAGITSWHLYLYAAAVWAGTLALTGYAGMLVILAKFAVAILLALGPLFILLLMFLNTRSLFDGWLKMLLNYAFIPVFVYTLLALLLALAEGPLRFMEENVGPGDQLLTAIGPYLLVCLIAVLLMGQITGIAAAVTGGAGLSTMGGATRSVRFAKDVQRLGFAASAWSWRASAPARRALNEQVSKHAARSSNALRSALAKTREVR